MRFLWKSQLKQERGRFVPQASSSSKKTNRKERLEIKEGRTAGAWLLVVLLWLFFLGTVSYLVLFSPYLALNTPRITGLYHIDETSFQNMVATELGQKYFGHISRDRFFLMQPERLAATIEARYPLIRSVHIERSFPSGLNITIEERDAIVLWCSQGVCLHVREDGSVFPITDVYQDELNTSRTLTITDESGQVVEPGEAIFEPEFVSFVTTLQKALAERLGVNIENTMTVSSRFANELRVKTTDGWGIYLSTRLPLPASLDALELLLKSEIPATLRSSLLYIDLRTENRIFYRYQDGHEEQVVTPLPVSPKPGATKEEPTKKKK